MEHGLINEIQGFTLFELVQYYHSIQYAVSVGPPNLQKSSLRTPKELCEEFLKMSISSTYTI